MSEGAPQSGDSGGALSSSAEGADPGNAAPMAGATSSASPAPGVEAESAASEEAAAAENKESRRSDLLTRLATAAILIPFVLWAVVQGGLVYLAIVVAIGVLAQHEFYGLIVDKGAKPIQSVGLGFGAAVILLAYFGNEYQAMLLMTASLLVMMAAQLRKNEIHEAMASISGTFFGVFYVAWLLSHAVLLRKFDVAAAYHHSPSLLVTLGVNAESGIFFMVFALVTVVLCDAGAYFAGRAWGKRKLAPQISPNKSVEGALGGIILGVLAGLATKLLFDIFWPDWSAAMPWSMSIFFGFILCVVGIIGDLVESLLKRDAKVKDTGALLPGMGGVLDRIDAHLLGLPSMYYLMLGYIYLQAS